MQELEAEKLLLLEEIKQLKKTKKTLTEEVKRLQSSVNTMATYEFNEAFIVNRAKEVDEKAKELEERKIENKNKLQVIKETRKEILDLREEQKSSFWKVSEHERVMFEEERPAFLNALCEVGTITGALKKAKCTTPPRVITKLRKEIPEFDADIKIALDIFNDELHNEALDRALNGTERPAFYKGDFIGEFRHKNDKLLETVLKANLPEKYDRSKIDKLPDSGSKVTYNIINYTTADETEEGFEKDIGVVKEVSSDGRIHRITSKKETEVEETIIDV